MEATRKLRHKVTKAVSSRAQFCPRRCGSGARALPRSLALLFIFRLPARSFSSGPYPLNFHLVHFFLRSAITQNICLQSFSHSNYFPGPNFPKSTPQPPHPLTPATRQESATGPQHLSARQGSRHFSLIHVNYLSCTRQSPMCVCPCVNRWMCVWVVGVCTIPLPQQQTSSPVSLAAGQGTYHNGAGWHRPAKLLL